MPRVPEAQPGQISTRALPGVDFTTASDPNAFRAGLANEGVQRSFSGLVNTVGEVVQKEKDKADVGLVDTKYYEAKKKMTTLLKGEIDEKTKNVIDPGFLSISGLDVDKEKANYDKKFKDFLSEAETGFTNDRQKELWQRERAKLEADFSSNVESHAFKERNDAIRRTYKDAVSIIQEDIMLNYAKPDAIQAGLKKQRDTLDKLADLEGYGKKSDSREILIKGAESLVHKGVVNSMLNDDQDLLASKYFNDNKDSFTKKDIDEVSRVLEEGSLRGESQRLTQSIMSENKSLTESLKLVDGKTDNPKVKDELRRRVKEAFSDREMAKRIDNEERFQSAFNKVDANPTKDAVPHEEWIKLNPSQQKSLYDWIDSKKKGAPQTDWTKWTDLWEMSSSPKTRDKFLAIDPLEYRPYLDDSKYAELVKLRGDLRSGKSDANLAIDGYRSDKQVVDDAMKASGFDMKSTNSEDIKLMNDFRSEVDRRVQVYKQRVGKKYIDNNELQTLVDGLLIEGIDPDSGFLGMFKTRKKAFEIKPGEQFEIDPESIPRIERNKIEDSLRRNGKPVDEESINRLYLLNLQRKGILD
jgi:hypothetical protein